jgi:hypothetical protein
VRKINQRQPFLRRRSGPPALQPDRAVLQQRGSEPGRRRCYLNDAEGVVLYASRTPPPDGAERLSQADDTINADRRRNAQRGAGVEPKVVAPFRANLSLIRILNLNSVWPMMVCLLMACA